MDRLELALKGLFSDERLEVHVGDEAVAVVQRGVRRRRHHRNLLAAAAGLAVVGVVAGSATALARPRAHPPPETVSVASMWRIGSPIPISVSTVNSMSGFRGALWVAGEPKALLRVDAGTQQAIAVPIGAEPLAVSYTPEQVWVATANCRLLQLTPIGRVSHAYHLPCSGQDFSVGLVANGNSAWVAVSSAAASTTSLMRFDGRRHRLTSSTTVAGHTEGDHPLTVGGDRVLLVTKTASASVLTSALASRLQTADTATLPVTGPADVAYEDRLYVSVGGSPGEVLSVDAARLDFRPVLDHAAADVTTADPLAWLLLRGDGAGNDQLVALTALTGQRVADVTLPRGRAEHVISDGGTVWVAMTDDTTGRWQLVPVRPAG